MRQHIRDLTLDQFLAAYPPIAGAQDPPAPVADPPQADPPADPPAAPAASDPPADPPKPAPKKDDEPETITLSRAEVDGLRRKVAEAEQAKRKSEREAREAEEAQQREQGKFEELAASKAKEAADLRAELATERREKRIARIATKLKFRDPQDVAHRLTDDEADDDTLAENALERIAEQSPHLVIKPSKPTPQIGQVHEPSAGDPGNGNGQRPKTVQDYEKLSAEQLAALPEPEFKSAMKLLAAAAAK